MDFRGRHRAESFRGEFQGGSGQHQCRARGRGRRAPGRATGGRSFRARAGAGLGVWSDLQELQLGLLGLGKGNGASP